MITKTKRKTVCAFSIICLLCMVGIFTSCGGKSQSDFVTIQTNSFTLAVPKVWTTETKPEVTFKKDGTTIGGVSELSYDSTQPISQFYGNHAEEISQKERNDLSLPATEVILRRTSPAAASVQSSNDELHYYFIDKNKQITYDLNFNSRQVDSETAEKIAKSFHLR